MAINTNALKRFAQEARKKLLDQVGSKLDFVLHEDSGKLREKSKLLATIKAEITKNGKEALIDKVAYTWFNRLAALRFMDANDYQPSGYKIISPVAGQGSPQILQEAHTGSIPEDLSVDRQQVMDLLDGKLQVNNPDNEAFRLLLIAACNQLHRIFPFLFERIDDYTELLLPDDLTSAFSIITDIVNGMPDEACEEVEVIGWLYQFYISEKKDELINAKKRYNADEIAPVTQLFTPKWIVEYMVDNTLGQLWKEARPNTTVTNDLEFYIAPHDPELIPSRVVDSVEDITFFDPCVGSAHVLCYAFDVFYKMYEEEGYSPTDIPELIISKNIFGIDIDDRAAQLASFALMMKGRKYHRRFFRKKVVPNITAFQDIASHLKFENAKVLGSLIKISKEEADEIEVDVTSLFGHEQVQLKRQASLLANKYDIVVTNPPYLNSDYMTVELFNFVGENYKDYKYDLYACFIEQCTEFTLDRGLIGMISPFGWMFNHFFLKTRGFIYENLNINSLIQLEYNAFEPAMVPVCCYVFNKTTLRKQGTYLRLSDFPGSNIQELKVKEALLNPKAKYRYLCNQNEFIKIPGSPVSYWVNTSIRDVFSNSEPLEKIVSPRQGMKTSNNGRFIRYSWEVENSKIGVGFESNIEASRSDNKWFPYDKGGGFRKWFGNNIYLLNWYKGGQEVLQLATDLYKSPTRTITAMSYYFLRGLTWSSLTSGSFSIRHTESGHLFDAKGSKMFMTYDNIEHEMYLLGFMNSKLVNYLLNVTSPTLDYNAGPIKKLPFEISAENLYLIPKVSSENKDLSKAEWDSREISWDFSLNELVRIKGQDLEETYDLYKCYWYNKFYQLHKNEEELNKQFIEIYGLQEELTPDVPLEDITILKDELNQKKLKELSSNFTTGWTLVNSEWHLEESSTSKPELPFDGKEVFGQFMSYAVGCMFGRYSLDKEALIIANQGETLQDYLDKVGLSEESLHFIPDFDNIIPVLDDEWFEDDIVGKFNDFLRASFGEQNFHKNRVFIEKALGKDIRSFFIRDFYVDHSKRYKKRPIYWQFSSPKKHFTVMVYMHRYTPDTLNKVLNDYLRPFMERVAAHQSQLKHSKLQGTASEQARIEKEIDRLQAILEDCQKYESEILFPLASERIPIDLDDGVLVNYNKFGDAIAPIAGLNDKKTKDNVKKFDWIDTTSIR